LPSDGGQELIQKGDRKLQPQKPKEPERLMRKTGKQENRKAGKAEGKFQIRSCFLAFLIQTVPRPLSLWGASPSKFQNSSILPIVHHFSYPEIRRQFTETPRKRALER
jgi:hypothetical protein